jgi:hypothetical protein
MQRLVNEAIVAKHKSNLDESWNELLDVAAYASHRFAGNRPCVRVNGLIAYPLTYGDKFSPDLLVLAR